MKRSVLTFASLVVGTFFGLLRLGAVAPRIGMFEA